MKKKPLTPEQFQQLLIATTNLPFIRQQRQPTSYLSDVLETVLNFQMQEPVVVKALQYFEHNVQHQHGIHTHEQLQDALNIFPDTEDGNKAAAQFFWGNKHWTRIELLRRFLPFLASIGVTDQASLHAWARQADFERDFKGRVKGMGIAVFHWLLLRCGVSCPWRFDPGYFLYYEDEDLCARIFQSRQMVMVEPAAQAVHANRGSVRGKSPLRSEWLRGLHHSRSKIRFQALYQSPSVARGVRRKAVVLGALEVLGRVLLLNPRLLARSAGRWWGMFTATLPTGCRC